MSIYYMKHVVLNNAYIVEWLMRDLWIFNEQHIKAYKYSSKRILRVKAFCFPQRTSWVGVGYSRELHPPWQGSTRAGWPGLVPFTLPMRLTQAMLCSVWVSGPQGVQGDKHKLDTCMAALDIPCLGTFPQECHQCSGVLDGQRQAWYFL